jgi:hypothetical protein
MKYVDQICGLVLFNGESYVIILTKNGLSNILVDFVMYSSGHPACLKRQPVDTLLLA